MVKAAVDVCYDSPVDGRPITSHAARQEDLKRNGCIEYDPEMKKDHERRVVEHDAALDRAVEESVCREVAKMPKKKKEQLIKEVVHQGVGAAVVRGGV